MAEWSLSDVLHSLHRDIEGRLAIVRDTIVHPTSKGDASERVWLELLQKYLPARYQALKGHVVDSKGDFSQQIDVIVCDRQYSPFIFHHEGELIVPAESIYAVFEAKQSINAEQVGYAREKVASVRRLHRTSLPIPHAGGTYPPKPLLPIIGGLLTFESDWKPPLGDSAQQNLSDDDADRRLELGCIAAHGYYECAIDGKCSIDTETKPAVMFLFKLIELLQARATVPMIDVMAYASWLAEKPDD